jgi:hypothetical protein
MKTNVFLPGTEYHMLLTLSIIEDRYSDVKAYHNLLVFIGKRHTGIDTAALPANVEFVFMDWDKDPKAKETTDRLILDRKPTDIFVFHSYRPMEVYLLTYAAPGTGLHLVQDGSNFYFRIDKTYFRTRLELTKTIWTSLRSKGIWPRKFHFATRTIKQSPYVDDIWITNPDIYVEVPNKIKPKVVFKLFPNEATQATYGMYFKPDSSNHRGKFEDYLFFLPPHLKEDWQLEKCVELLRELVAKLGKKHLMIKIHPNSPQRQLEHFTREFGDVVVRNHIPAELYFANASDTVIISAASTSLLYYNPRCRYYALIHFFHKIGLYPPWKHLNIPSWVLGVEQMDEIYAAESPYATSKSKT